MVLCQFLSDFCFFFSSLNGAILSGLAVCWTPVWEGAGGYELEVSWGKHLVSLCLCCLSPLSKISSRDENFAYFPQGYLHSVCTLCNEATFWEFVFVNYTWPVFNSIWPSPIIPLCYIATLLVANMDVVLFHILYSISYSSCGPAFLVTLHSLLFQTRNHGSGALRLCLLPLWNSMPCLRSVKVCIYYAQLNPNLTVFLIVFGLVLSF